MIVDGSLNLLWNVVLLSLMAGLATGVGGLIVAFLPKFTMRTYDGLLGFAAGVMTSVATLGLIQKATQQESILVVLLGVAAGALMLFLLDRFLPHQHVTVGSENQQTYRRGLLLFSALALHNIPEGLAVGTSYTVQPQLGMMLALAIALHNIPEGIAVAGPFRACGLSRWRCVAWAAGSGLAEPIAALLGAAFILAFQPIMPFCLAFAGGAMLYVVSDELIPESHSHGFEHEATLGFLTGFLMFLALLYLLG